MGLAWMLRPSCAWKSSTRPPHPNLPPQGGKGQDCTSVLGPEDGEDLVGIREPGLDPACLLRLAAAQFGHRAQHEEPVERFLVAVLFDVLQRGLAPELVVPGDHGVEVEAVSFDVGMEVAGAAAEEGV